MSTELTVKRRRALAPLPPAPVAPAQLINLQEVCRRAGLGRETIRKLILAGKFPPKIKDPDVRATRWSAQAVEQWIQDRIARSARNGDRSC